MTKEFVPYEIALALKKLGFDEPCLGYYVNVEVPNPFLVIRKISDTQGGYFTFAPLYQQAFRWFREKHDLVIEQCVPFQRLYSTEDDHFEILEFGYRIYSFDQYRGGLRDKIEWDGYGNSNEEEAEIECLKKLIEIVKK
jgi:hypothetical protein